MPFIKIENKNVFGVQGDNLWVRNRKEYDLGNTTGYLYKSIDGKYYICSQLPPKYKYVLNTTTHYLYPSGKMYEGFETYVDSPWSKLLYFTEELFYDGFEWILKPIGGCKVRGQLNYKTITFAGTLVSNIQYWSSSSILGTYTYKGEATQPNIVVSECDGSPGVDYFTSPTLFGTFTPNAGGSLTGSITTGWLILKALGSDSSEILFDEQKNRTRDGTQNYLKFQSEFLHCYFHSELDKYVICTKQQEDTIFGYDTINTIRILVEPPIVWIKSDGDNYNYLGTYQLSNITDDVVEPATYTLSIKEVSTEIRNDTSLKFQCPLWIKGDLS